MKVSPVDRAKEAYDERRRRDREMPASDIFGEPAWDVLLLLFIARQQGRTMELSTLVHAIAGPPTTTIRWLKVLETKALVEPLELAAARQRAVALSDHGNLMMCEFFK